MSYQNTLFGDNIPGLNFLNRPEGVPVQPPQPPDTLRQQLDGRVSNYGRQATSLLLPNIPAMPVPHLAHMCLSNSSDYQEQVILGGDVQLIYVSCSDAASFYLSFWGRPVLSTLNSANQDNPTTAIATPNRTWWYTQGVHSLWIAMTTTATRVSVIGWRQLT